MAFSKTTSGDDDAEQKLSDIARTEPWEFPEEFTRFKEALDDQVVLLNRSRDVLMEPGVFECSARENALACSDAIVGYIRGADLDRQFAELKDRIDRYNQAIYDARNVWLPGDRLDDESVRRIMEATEPLNLVVPGLGAVAGVAGVAGVNLVSRMLAGHREEVAKREYQRIKRSLPGGLEKKPLSSAPDINGIWPAPSGSGSSETTAGSRQDNRGGWDSGSLKGTSVGVAAAGAGAAVTEYGVPLPHGVGKGTGDVSGAAARRSPNSADNTAGGRIQSGYHDASDDHAGSHRRGAGRGMPSGSGGVLSGDGRTGGAVGRGTGNDRGMGVDSAMGSADSWQAGVIGRTVFAAGAGAGVGAGAGGMLAARRVSAGTAGVSAGVGAGQGGPAVGVAGLGSYYANTPVKASVVSSSIKGATGMAAGLRKGELARAAASESGVSRGAAPGMMGAGRAGASGGKGKRRNTMGYIAPTIEEDEEFTPKPLAAMAGHLKRPDE